MAKKQLDPLPAHTVDEIRASQEAPLPAGVTMVRMNKCVTALQTRLDGVAVLERPDRPWRALPPLTAVRRGRFIRSRVRLRFADGTKTTVRPYKLKHKGPLETGRRDSLTMPTATSTSGDGHYDSTWDGVGAVFVILVAIVLFPISIFMLGREVFGTSARAKQAAVLVPQLQASIADR